MYPESEHSHGEGAVEARYGELARWREPFLKRARECAALTIPGLLPRHDNVQNQKLHTPNQAVGAAGVNNLASKLQLALFPPNSNFFRLIITSFDLDAIVAEAAMVEAQETGESPERIMEEMRQRVVTEAQQNLGRVEKAVVEDYEAEGNRPTDFEVLKHLVAVGNVLRFVPLKKGDKPRYYPLNQYVVSRDPDGTVREIVVKEGVSPSGLSREVRETCKIPPKGEDGGEHQRTRYDLYTMVQYNEESGKWDEWQELNGIEVPESRGTYKKDLCPWLALRWSKIDGEDYGRGHTEDYLGDLISLEALMKALIDGSLGSAKLLYLLNPNAVTKATDIAQAPNGAVRTGLADDVSVLRTDKGNDFAVALQGINILSRDLGQAFLLTSSVQRSGERVTATEITKLTGELEKAFGGNYAVLSLEYLLPLVKLKMYAMQTQNRLPKLPEEVQPTILTGVHALGRTADLERDVAFLEIIGKLPVSQDELALTLKPHGVYQRIATHLGVETRGILRGEEESAQLKQEAQQAALAQQAVGPAIQAAGRVMGPGGPAQEAPVE